MEALLILNSVIVAICLYFMKDFHTDFKEVKNKVFNLDKTMGKIESKLDTHVESCKVKIRKVN